MRSSRHQVASAACSDLGRARHAPGSRPPRRLPACPPSARRRPWCGRRAPPRRRAAPGACLRWRTRTPRPQSSPHPWPPRTVRPRPDRLHATGAQPVRGDQVLARAPVAPVGSMHHTCPSRARVPSVWRRRSLLTLAASTGPRHPRMAGTAKLVVFPLWVGPDHDQGLGRLGGQARQPRHTGQDAEEEPARQERPRRPPAAGAGRAAGPSARPAPVAVRARPPSSRQHRPAPVRRCRRSSAPPRASGRTTSGSAVTAALPRRHGRVGVDDATVPSR